MSKMTKASLLVSGLFILASGVIRLILNMWHDSLYVGFGLALVFFLIAIAKDWRMFAEFLTMRTTKHGMNMGAMILIALVALISINFIAVKKDKRFDWTSERLNSLSDQSVKAAKAIDDNLNVVLLTRKGQQDDEAIRRGVQDLVKLYHDINPKIDFVPYDARQRPDLAQQYGFTSGSYGLFTEYKGKQSKIEMGAQATAPPSEEDLTKALIRVMRSSKKAIYVTQGRGEPSLDSSEQDPNGLSFLKQDLEALYTVKPYNMVTTPKIPDDAAAIVIIGPHQQFLPTELQTLRDYARNGGHLLIAADPGIDHGLAQLTKTLGVEFFNNYVLDPRAQIPGRGNVAALGSLFSKANNITKDFQPGNVAVFELASAVGKAPDAPPSWTIDEIVRTDESPLIANALKQEAVRAARPGKAVALAIAVTGKFASETEAPAKEFSVVVFGDSNFVTNAMYRGYLNRDLVMNSIASITNDTELISIRPKTPKGSVLEVRSNVLLFLLISLLALPIAMFASGGVIWFRRRTA